MSEPSSLGSRTPLAFFDPGSVCLRMSQGTFLKEEPELLPRLPDWGTTQGGVLYEHQTPERLIDARDGSASPGLPTPVVNDMGAGKTVEAWDNWTDEMKAKHGNSNGHGPSLSIEIARLLPTPTSVDSKVFGPGVDWEKRITDHAPHTASVLMTLPSDDGNESSDDPPPTQQTTEDSGPSLFPG